MRYVNLRKLTVGVEFFDRALELWQQAIERANSWSVTGDYVKFSATEGGYSLAFLQPNECYTAVVTTAITARELDGSALGAGRARLKLQKAGGLIEDGQIVDVFSGFKISIPVGTWIEVTPHKGFGYKLIGSDCLT